MELKVEEIFENQILNDIYETRGDGFEGVYIKMYGKPEEVENSEKIEDEFTVLVKDKVKDKKIQEQILEKFSEFQDCTLGEMCLWDKQYYKLGFIDGMYLKKEMKESKEIFLSNKVDNDVKKNRNSSNL